MADASASIELPAGRHGCLLLHRLAGSPLEVRFVGKLLQRAGFSVHIPRIEGYSMGSAGGSWEEWADAAGEIYAALSRRYATVSLAGLSSGATLALALALRARAPQALALWGVTLFYDGWAVPWHQWLFEPCYRVGLAAGFGYREREPYGLKNEKWRARVAHAMSRHGASSAGPALIPAKFLFEAIRLGRFVRKNLHAVACDTLIIHAADDETAS